MKEEAVSWVDTYFDSIDEVYRYNPIDKWLKLKPVKLIKGLAIAKFVFTKEMTNFTGTVVHGGIVSTVLDHMCGMAVCLEVGPERFRYTMENKVSFFYPVEPGVVQCRGQVVNVGGRVVFVEGELTIEEKVYAKSTGTVFIAASKSE